MRAGADLTGGLALAENLAARLSPALGRLAAHDLVDAVVRRAVAAGRPLRDTALADPAIAERLSPRDVDDALDPGSYLGSAGAFVDRALAARGLLHPPVTGP
jgi:3-carboxy-cis,cis-muconate cycloisomerase